MKPAVRIGDMHVCPMFNGPQPHVGGAISKGASKTQIEGSLAARVTDTCACPGPPNAIAVGSLGVIVENLCAARLLDPTMHGGVIQMRMPMPPRTLIGDQGNPLILIAQAVNPHGSVINCGHNVTSIVGRLDGSNPNAVSPAGQDGSFTDIGNRHGTNVAWGQGNDMNAAFDSVRAGGHGTTAVVGIDYGNGSSHVVPVTNHYGTPVIIEAQNWGPGQPVEVITSPAAANARYSPADIGIGLIP